MVVTEKEELRRVGRRNGGQRVGGIEAQHSSALLVDKF